MMKRMLCCALALMLALGLAASASAEIVGYAADGDYIHRYLAPNGQELFFVSMMMEPFISFEDVNRDGTEDIVVVTALGASNAFYEFFVWDGEKYVMARHEGEIINYSLTPSGLVVSHGTSGWAGALFEDRIFRWNGTDLVLVRKMVSEQEETVTFTEESYTVVQSMNSVSVRLWDYTQGEGELDETLLWEARYTLDELEQGTPFALMEEKFMEGIEMGAE